jgi:hypothetical protein
VEVNDTVYHLLRLLYRCREFHRSQPTTGWMMDLIIETILFAAFLMLFV